MIDPMLSLAMSTHANPGVYALLLGSGVSRSAGIPTGWEVVLDLIRRLAAIESEDCEPDPEAWYKGKYGIPLRGPYRIVAYCRSNRGQPNAG